MNTIHEANRWKIADLLHATVDAGLRPGRILESPGDDERFWEVDSYESGSQTHLMDWQQNPRADLPVWLTLALQKPGSGGHHAE
jgi:hypothetical protein